MTIIGIVIAFIAADIAIDYVLLKRMGHSPSSVVRSAWYNIKAKFTRKRDVAYEPLEWDDSYEGYDDKPRR